MFRQSLAFLTLASLALSAVGLRCWTCENADLSTCKRKGTVRQCNTDNQESCQTEVRYSEERTVIIRTGCKQGTACLNNGQQNPGGAWHPTQCNDGTKNSVCRCCCAGNLCNRKSGNLLCKFPEPRNRPVPTIVPKPVEKTCDRYPETPVNGERICIGGYGLRAFCKFTCDDGYILKGDHMTVCVQRWKALYWNRPAPTCEKEDLCDPMPEAPDHGYKRCKGEGELGSVCQFGCNIGYELKGPPATTCDVTDAGAQWSHRTPTCQKLVCDPMPQFPLNGRRKCDGDGELGTVCDFSCESGYKLSGSPATRCIKATVGARWSNQTPQCIELICKPLPDEPKHGQRECDGEGSIGTVCSYACNLGYELDGPPITTCKVIGDDAQWSHRTPKCKPICKTLPREPDNGFKRCNGNGELGTICTFDCKSGHEMNGFPATTCIERRGEADWSHRPPTCEPVCKPLPEAPAHGKKKCTGTGEVGTLCTYECDAGYQMNGPSETSCEKTMNGADWTNETPTCTFIPFCSTMPTTPQNGKKTCVGTGEIGTVCVFECDQGYQRSGSLETTCERMLRRVDWSHESPTCEPICKPMPEAPSHGNQKCTGIGEVGTQCIFQCDSGYEMNGPSETSCEKTRSGADWSNGTPTCTIIPVCDPMPNTPQNGEKSCTGTGEIGTVCVFECDPGYERSGPLKTNCERIASRADWSHESPSCNPIPKCDIPNAPENGAVTCTGTGEIGTVCAFECNRGYERTGSLETNCERTSSWADWSHESPSCDPIPKCDIPNAPENGAVSCDGNGEDGTQCKFSCDETYILEGSDATTCERDGNEAEWSHKTPKCTAPEPVCTSLGELPGGSIECDEDINRVGQVCRYRCLEKGFEMVPDAPDTTTCDANLKWTVEKPCCVECMNSKKDIAIAMDSSGSINPSEWKTMLQFVQNIVRGFNVSKEAVQFSIFQFSSAPRSDGFMYFGRYKKQQLIKKVGKMKRMGSGTMTGDALEFARKRFADPGNRAGVSDLLVVLTDGAAEDMKKLIRASRTLRKDEVEILALAIGPTEDFVDQMTKMTGDKEKVLVADNVESLTNEIVQQITTKICQDPEQCAK